MNYQRLGLMIAGMTQDQRDANVTVLLKLEGEVFSIHDFVTRWPNISSQEGRRLGVPKVDGVIDQDHPYLVLVSCGRDTKTEIETAISVFNLLDPKPILNDEENGMLEGAIAVLESADLMDENGDLIDEDGE